MRVYLSGPIKDATDEEAKEWRAAAKAVLERGGVKCLDPMRRDYRADPVSHLPGLVEDDKIDIEMCDIILVNFLRPSVGTSMEIIYGWERGERIITVGGDRNDGWIVYHSHHMYDSMYEAYDKIFDLSKEYGHLS